MVLSDFYSADMLASAKILLMEDTDTLNLATKRPYIPLRRDGDGRLAREVDDILSLLTFLDEQKALEQLPVYVSDGPDNMPSVRLYEGDLFALTKWMKSMDERMHSVELALAGISTDVRKTQVWPCLPESDVRCQPQVQSATSVYLFIYYKNRTCSTKKEKKTNRQSYSVQTDLKKQSIALKSKCV